MITIYWLAVAGIIYGFGRFIFAVIGLFILSKYGSVIEQWAIQVNGIASLAPWSALGIGIASLIIATTIGV